MIRGTLLSLLAAALALPGPAGAQGYEEGGYEPEQGEYREPQTQVDQPAQTARPEAAPTLEDFQNGLSPYGDWVASSQYGRVWRPYVPTGWRPYYNGYWTWSDDGWFWASDEPWAWATYHYGRWVFDPALGWTWVPGYQWAPAWVTWRFGPDAIGWAPLLPGSSIYATSYPSFFFAWTFVPAVRFVGFPVHRFAFAPSFAHRFFPFTRPAPPRFAWGGFRAPAWGGPPHRFVEQRSGRPIAPARIAPGWGHPGGASVPWVARGHGFGGGFNGGFGHGGSLGGRGFHGGRR